MILTLEVSARQGGMPGARKRQAFDENGGTLGRAQESSLVLPHGKVSGRHALITHRNAVFYIEDTSRNGICVNSVENRLVPGRPYALKSGDRILIDPFEIQVSITEDPGSPVHQEDPFALPDSAQAELSSIAPESETGEEVDPIKILGLGTSTKSAVRRKPPLAEGLAHGSPLDDNYQPPKVVPVSPPSPVVEAPPPGYDPLAPDDTTSITPLSPRPVEFDEPEPAQAPVPPQPPVSRARPTQPTPAPARVPAEPDTVASTSLGISDSDLAEMLDGAGLDRSAVSPELARSFGQILRVVVSGVMDVLQSRRQIREEFGLRLTHFRPTDNNPLKFSANVEDALHNLLVKRNAAYLPPVEAFADAFEDLRNHQLAMLAGMRVAFESMLAEFDPEGLQEQFDRQRNKGSLVSVPAKLRYWDAYRDRWHDIVKDPEASFRELFGEEFARAYEDQLKRLKAAGTDHPGKGKP